MVLKRSLGRRSLLKAGGALSVGGATAFALRGLFRERSLPSPQNLLRTEAAGQDPTLVRDPQGVLDLGPGFRYRIIERAGALMDDGLRVPGRPDGMACFANAAGQWVLMRNHELLPEHRAMGALPPQAEPLAEAYDPNAFGGVTRVVIDPVSKHRVSSNLVLTGTHRNCAGGPSPWGWLSCEENVAPGHGYVFVCSTDAERVQPAQRVRGYGRFNHEAAAIEPETHVAYLSEDRIDGCLYRFVPTTRDAPFLGQLQALRVVDAPQMDTGRGLTVGQKLRVGWIDVEDPEPERDELRHVCRAKGAAILRRGEGLWFADGALYLSATVGGPERAGQIFRLQRDETGEETLELLAQAQPGTVLDMPDNLTVAPWGDVFIAEDGWGAQSIRRLTADGAMHEFARNALSNSEFAGLCFSPDASTLFVNIQVDGLTLAIEGPFQA